jgi:hypothetical protein
MGLCREGRVRTVMISILKGKKEDVSIRLYANSLLIHHIQFVAKGRGIVSENSSATRPRTYVMTACRPRLYCNCNEPIISLAF